MADTTEPTNEALIARIAYLTERAEKAEATMERLGLVEDVTFDAADNSVSEWKNIRAEATEAELARTREALAEGAKAFRWYEQIHASKTPPDTDKAARNREFAEKLEAALAKPEPAPQEMK